MSKRLGPPSPVKAPEGVQGDDCKIVFGHNVSIRKVMMQFSVRCDRLVFSPEDADHVAANLTQMAMLARGSKAS